MASSCYQQVVDDELEKKESKLLIERELTPPIPIIENEPVPEEDFSTYFENFISKRIDDYYCNMCDKDFVSVSSIMEHLNDPEHMSLVSDKPRNQDLDEDSVITFDFCKILVKNNIFRHDLLLKCYSCELIIESHNDVEDHIDSPDHKFQRFKFGEAQKSAGASNKVGTISKKYSHLKLNYSPLSDLKDDFVKYFDNFIEKHGDNYLCYLCHVKLLSTSTALSHINQEDHKNLLALRRTNNKIKSQGQRDPNRCKLLVENGIFQFIRSSFRCDACQCDLESYKVAKKHSRESQHIEKLNLHFEYKLSQEKDAKRPWVTYQKYSDYVSIKEENNELLVGEENKKENEEVIVQKYPDYINVDYEDDDKKTLTCFICSSTQLWIKHKDTAEHNLRKRFFLDNFVDTPGDRVLCLRCKTTVPKCSVIDHASERHQLMPWYRPPDEFIIYFKNFIQPMGKRYYCYLCDRTTSRWYLSLDHIKNLSHSRCVKKSIREIDINQQALTFDFCEEMSTNGIFSLNIRKLRCWTCQYVIDSYNDAYRHIKSHEHETALREKKSKILSRSYGPAINLQQIALKFPSYTNQDSTITSEASSVTNPYPIKAFEALSVTDRESIVDVETPLIPNQEATVAVKTSSVTDQEPTITFEAQSVTDEESTKTLEAQSAAKQENIIVLDSRFKTFEDECLNETNTFKNNEEFLKSKGLEESIFLKYFENSMGGSIERNKIHCYLCHKFAFTVPKSLEHIDDERHQTLKQNSDDKNKIIIHDFTNLKFFKLYFKNFIIPFKHEALNCVKCNQCLEQSEVSAHVNTKEHKEKCGFRKPFRRYKKRDP